MSYQALYRVWRPQRFDELVGQQMVTRTLKNAIITNQISHAYLFAGPRGTGKTSAAKIFAKAVNCHHQKDGEPCNQCDTCKAITNGTLNDVIEIDAASNNGVSEIRDIRDKVKYAPTQADYKVYIIDEVHMLSTGAFNALLKTLEEPPANVIFILATTEPHKIPLTIISRVQRFDFRRISAEDAFKRMKYILDSKHVDYEENALWVIAHAAEGGMRDALSILDQVLSFGADHVTLKDAQLVTGSVTKKLLKQYFLQVCDHDAATALGTMHDVLSAGKDGQRFIEELVAFIRDVLLYEEAPKLLKVEQTGLAKEDFDQLAKAAKPQVMYAMIDELNAISDEMRFTTHPDVYLEVLTVKLCQLHSDAQTATAQTGENVNKELENLQQEVRRLQSTIKQLQANGVTTAPAANHSPQLHTTTTTPTSHRVRTGTGAHRKARVRLSAIYPVLENATRDDLNDVRNNWSKMVEMLTVPQQAVLHVAKPVAASPKGLVVSFNYGFMYEQATDDSDLIHQMELGLQQLSGADRKIEFVPENKWPQIRKDFIAEHHLKSKKKQPAAAAKPVTTTDSQASTKASAASATNSQQASVPSQSANKAGASKSTTLRDADTADSASSQKGSAAAVAQPPLPDEPPVPSEGDEPFDDFDQPADSVAAAQPPAPDDHSDTPEESAKRATKMFGKDIVKIVDD